MHNFDWPVRHANRHNTDYIPIDGVEQLRVQSQVLLNIPASTVAIYDKQTNLFLSTLNKPSESQGTLWSFDMNGNYRWHTDLPTPSLTSPALDSIGNVFVCDGSFLYKFSNNGNCIWKVACPVETSAITFIQADLILILGINGSLRIFCPENGALIAPIYNLPTSSPKKHLGHKEMPKYIFEEIFTQGIKNIGVSKKHFRHIKRRFFGKNVAAKHVPAVLSNDVILVVCQSQDGLSNIFYKIIFNNKVLTLECSIEIGPGCDTSPTVSADETLAFIIDKNGILYAIDLLLNQIAWTKQLPNASSASPNITTDNLLYISIKTDIICLKVNREQGTIFWHRKLIELTNQKQFTHCYINSVLAITNKYLYAVGAYGNLKVRFFSPKVHYLFILERNTGDCKNMIQLTHESFCTLSIMPNGNILIPSKPFYQGIASVLNLKSYLPFTKRKDFYGLTILIPNELYE